MKKIASLFFIIIFCVCRSTFAQQSLLADTSFPYKNLPDVFPGTKPLTWDGDISIRMMDGAHQFIEEKINEAIANRAKLWNRNFNSVQAYEKSVEGNRKRFMKCIGVEDES